MFAYTLTRTGQSQWSVRDLRNQISLCSAESGSEGDAREWISDCFLEFKAESDQPRLLANAQKLTDM